MKKLLKVLALALAMCMLLSTAAFATTSTATPDETANTIDIEVHNAGAGNEVVVLVVDSSANLTAATLSSATEGQIMYIDQQPADSEGVASFPDIMIKNINVKVDVWAGSAITDGPKLIAEDVVVKEVATITLVSANATSTISEDAESGRKAIAAQVTIKKDEGLTIQKMYWALSVLVNGAESRRYALADKSTGSEDKSSGNLQFAAAFKLGKTSDTENVITLPEDGANVGLVIITGTTADDVFFTEPELDKGNGDDETNRPTSN